MQPGDVTTPPRTKLHAAILGVAVLSLCAAAFANPDIAAGMFYLRFAAVGGLVLLVLAQSPRIPTAERTNAVRVFLGLAWTLVVFAATSAAWSIDPNETALQATVLALLVALLHVHCTRRWTSTKVVARDLATVHVALGVTMLGSAATGTLVGARLGGLYDNPNTLGAVAALNCAIGIGLLADRVTALRVAVFAVSAYCLLGSESRSSLAGLLVAAAYVVARRVRHVSPAGVVATCFAGVGLLGYLLVAGRTPVPAVVTRFLDARGEADPFNGREAAWRLATGLWEMRPWGGWGWRAGEVAFQRYRPFNYSFTADGAHSSYFQVLLEVGVIGLGLFVLMLAVAFVRAFRARLDSGVTVALVAVVITGAVSGLAESTLFGVGQPVPWVFWLAAAGLVALPDSANGHQYEKPPAPSKVTVTS